MSESKAVVLEGEVLEMANELARRNDQSVVIVLQEALKEMLTRDVRLAEREARVARIMAIGADIRAHLIEPACSRDTDAFYGPDGLPQSRSATHPLLR